MSQSSKTETDRADRASIATFFDSMSNSRNEVFRTNPVLDYEQRVRSRAVLDRLQVSRGETILDIGCGNARDIVPMLERGAVVVGVDLSEGMIAQARAELAAAGHPDVRLEVGDATALPFADHAFDKVICSEVIEHIPEAGDAIREIARVLVPGGRLVVSTPNRRSWYGFDRYVLFGRVLRRRWNHPYDNWRRMEELTRLLEDNGFRIERTSTVCYMPGFALTYFLPRALQSGVVAIVKRVEPIAARLATRTGYLLVVTATRR